MLLWLYLPNGKTTDNLLNEAYELADVPNKRELDVLLSCGELLSASKLSILLNNLGYSSVSLTGLQAGIFTNNTNQNAVIETIDTSRILKELELRRIVIVAGFQGYNSNLDITTLGRGGSDTTAVALAASLNASHCYIFSDVDGVYTLDPNKFPEAKKLEAISYDEMLNIANEGAKVLQNRCIEIAKKFDIPIIAKSTFNNNSGTVINSNIEEGVVKSIVKNDMSRIAIVGYEISSNNLVLSKILKFLQMHNLEIYNIDLTYAKIIITFKKNIPDNVVEMLHNELFN